MIFAAVLHAAACYADVVVKGIVISQQAQQKSAQSAQNAGQAMDAQTQAQDAAAAQQPAQV